MKQLFFLFIVALLLHVSPRLFAQTTSNEMVFTTKSKADLIKDIGTNEDGGYKAEAARKIAVQTQEIDVIAAGLIARSYNTRGGCIKSLGAFPANQQKAALATALGDGTAWNEARIGEDRAAQEVLGGQILQILKGFGINATLKDLLNPTARKLIADQLVAPQ